MSGDLVDFLLERISEDERAAREAYRDLEGDDCAVWLVAHDAVLVADSLDQVAVESASQRDGHVAPHIARWDPARALAECEAKRRIIEWHQNWPVLVQKQPTFEGLNDDLSSTTLRMSQQIMWATEQEYRKKFGDEPPTGPILRLLALPYADHPAYREEWRA